MSEPLEINTRLTQTENIFQLLRHANLPEELIRDTDGFKIYHSDQTQDTPEQDKRNTLLRLTLKDGSPSTRKTHKNYYSAYYNRVDLSKIKLPKMIMDERLYGSFMTPIGNSRINSVLKMLNASGYLAIDDRYPFSVKWVTSNHSAVLQPHFESPCYFGEFTIEFDLAQRLTTSINKNATFMLNWFVEEGIKVRRLTENKGNEVIHYPTITMTLREGDREQTPFNPDFTSVLISMFTQTHPRPNAPYDNSSYLVTLEAAYNPDSDRFLDINPASIEQHRNRVNDVIYRQDTLTYLIEDYNGRFIQLNEIDVPVNAIEGKIKVVTRDYRDDINFRVFRQHISYLFLKFLNEHPHFNPVGVQTVSEDVQGFYYTIPNGGEVYFKFEKRMVNDKSLGMIFDLFILNGIRDKNTVDLNQPDNHAYQLFYNIIYKKFYAWLLKLHIDFNTIDIDYISDADIRKSVSSNDKDNLIRISPTMKSLFLYGDLYINCKHNQGRVLQSFGFTRTP